MSLLQPPRVRHDIDVVNAAIWGAQPLGCHVGDLERLLMIDADAPLSFDGIPLRDTNQRSKVLVEVCAKSFSANPALAPMIKRVGPALRTDRGERVMHIEDQGFEEGVERITRHIEVKPEYRQRG